MCVWGGGVGISVVVRSLSTDTSRSNRGPSSMSLVMFRHHSSRPTIPFNNTLTTLCHAPPTLKQTLTCSARIFWRILFIFLVSMVLLATCMVLMR